MRKYFFMLLIIPVIGMGQNKTILTSNRLVAKNDKVSEFERALANHSQKYHTGDVKWRVWSIESGPDAGGYMVTEGPSNWTTLDGRGDISVEHNNHWEKTVLPLTVGAGQTAYLDFDADLSTVQLTDYADKIVINHVTAKPGKVNHVIALLQKQKKVWAAGKESVAVYSLEYSGEPGFNIVNRLRDGLKELDGNYRKPFGERYNEVYGAGSWDSWLKDYAEAVQMRWSELLTYKPKLSSK